MEPESDPEPVKKYQEPEPTKNGPASQHWLWRNVPVYSTAVL